MPLNDWANGVLGGTPLDADRLNDRDSKIEAALLALARDPEALFAGSVTNNPDGAATSADCDTHANTMRDLSKDPRIVMTDAMRRRSPTSPAAG